LSPCAVLEPCRLALESLPSIVAPKYSRGWPSSVSLDRLYI